MTDAHPQLASLPKPPENGLLRFIICGSVDDGKSTLIGRLLYDSKLVLDDQVAALERDSRLHRTTAADLDLTLLVDGLEAEREQGITIDVAYRFFSTTKRSFIVADTPGHEQYTRNMATGASTADLGVMMVDARKGPLVQTRRHAIICSLLGIRHLVVAVNKIDLVHYDARVFDRIVTDFASFTAGLGFRTITPIPISARFGDNVTRSSDNTVWYRGPSLIEHLETIDVTSDTMESPFRFPVQWVNRPSLNFRGFAGTVVAGRVSVGDAVMVAGSGRSSRVDRIVTQDGDLPRAEVGEAVTLTLADEIDVAQGDVLCPPTDRPQVADQFAAHVIWVDDAPLLPGRSYIMRIGTKMVPATVTEIKHKLDVNTHGKLAAKTLALNEIGFCNLSTGQLVAFDRYEECCATGAFILIDRTTRQTAAAGMIDFALRRATNIHWQSLTVDKESRSRIKHQRPCILWFTGLSGSGKSTIANLVESRLIAGGHHTMLLDGDNIRHGLSRDLGFTNVDRVENIRRIGEVAKLFTSAGLIVICSFISPFEAERQLVRGLVEPGEFVEIFVDTSLATCIARDPKGLYARALVGEIRNFTGIGSAYERPTDAEFTVDTERVDAVTAAEGIIEKLVARGVIGL